MGDFAFKTWKIHGLHGLKLNAYAGDCYRFDTGDVVLATEKLEHLASGDTSRPIWLGGMSRASFFTPISEVFFN